MAVEVGQDAPDFTLRDHTGEERTLSSYRGQSPVLLVFHPFSFTGICEAELCQLRDDHSQYEQAGVQVLALSCDASPSQKAWAEQQGWGFPVLSDFWPHGAVAKAYGIFNEDRGCAMRATFLVGIDGKIVDTFATDAITTPREAGRYTEALAKL